MRVIRIELVGKLQSNDHEISLISEELRELLFQELHSLDAEITEAVRERASAYVPPDYSVFVRTRLKQESLSTVTELWIVDPSVRWPSGLLTRSAWKLLAPILAHVVRDSFESRLHNVSLEVDPKTAKIVSLAPTRTWRDPVLLCFAMIILTSAYWLYVHDWLKSMVMPV